MDTASAMIHIQHGGKIRRPGWSENTYYYFDGGKIWMKTTDYNKRTHYDYLAVSDVLADDWEEYKEQQQIIEVSTKNLRVGDEIIFDGVNRKIERVNIVIRLEDSMIDYAYGTEKLVQKVIK